MKKISLMGLGTVGMGVYELIENKKLIDFEIAHVLVKNINKKRDNVDMSKVTNRKEDLDDCDILVELTGNHDDAYMMIKRHLEMGHDVVTANKELMATYLYELSALAKKNNCYLLYDASVGGAIPIISNLLQSRNVNSFDYITGILNGTTNFILYNAFNSNEKLKDIIDEAIRIGFAEPDPSADLLGLDMARKMAILSKLAYHVDFDIKDIEVFGLNNITDLDIAYLKERGYLLKFVAESVNKGDIIISVYPILINKFHPLSGVNNEFNSILLSGSYSDELMFSGKGAGRYPTAYSVLDDLFKIYHQENKLYPECEKVVKLGHNNEPNRYYIRKGNNMYITESISREEFNRLDYDFYAILRD